MIENPRLQQTVLVAVTIAIAGCSGYASAAHSALLPGPSGATAMIRLAAAKSQPSPKPRLYVAEVDSNKILIFDPTAPSPTPEATITKGLSRPFGIAVDGSGNLYVANSGNRTVTVYRPGKLTPTFTIDNGLGQGAEAVTVDSKGNVFVCTFHRRLIVAFHPGHKHAYQTIRLAKGTPGALAVDADDNVYVADDTYVYEIPRGTAKPIDLGLSGLSGADGISFANGIMYVANYTLNDVTAYKKGETKPFLTITGGLQGPTYSTFVRSGELFVDNNIEWKVEGFKPRHVQPFITILGLQRPMGIAAVPLQNP